MRGCHTQARPQCRAITSKALVNRTRTKVVKMKLTKFFEDRRQTLGVVPANAGTHNHRWLLNGTVRP